MHIPTQYQFGISDAYNLMIWLGESYPQIFKEWVCIRDIEPIKVDEVFEIKETKWD